MTVTKQKTLPAQCSALFSDTRERPETMTLRKDERKESENELRAEII